MNIRGREYGMLLTVKARGELRALCPGEDVKNLDEFLSGPEELEHATQIILLLSKGYEDYRAYWDAQEGKTYEPHPLTEELIENLSMEEHMELQRAALDALRKGFGITVETEEPKEGKGKKAEAAAEEKQN